jgi:hypothetical protein
MKPGSDRKTDSEYIRNGTCGIFAFVEPLGGCHHCEAKDRRTAVDWANRIRFLVDGMYPDAEAIVLAMDNLNTHAPSSLYKAFPPEEARRILRKLELHYTPQARQLAQYGRDRAECDDPSVFVPASWQSCTSVRRTRLLEKGEKATIKWQFTTRDARVKLKSLYPIMRTESGYTSVKC